MLLWKKAHLFSLQGCKILWNWINACLHHCLWCSRVWSYLAKALLPLCIHLLLPGDCGWSQAEKMALRSFLPRFWYQTCRDDGAMAIWAVVALCCSCGVSNYQHLAAPWWMCRECVSLFPGQCMLNYSCYCYPSHCCHARDAEKLWCSVTKYELETVTVPC